MSLTEFCLPAIIFCKEFSISLSLLQHMKIQNWSKNQRKFCSLMYTTSKNLTIIILILSKICAMIWLLSQPFQMSMKGWLNTILVISFAISIEYSNQIIFQLKKIYYMFTYLPKELSNMSWTRTK